MIPALILVISAATLLQFFVTYCRSLLAASSQVDVSEDVRELTKIRRRDVPPGEFPRLFTWIRLCPEPESDRLEVRAVRGYFALLSLVWTILGPLFPLAATWMDEERSGCAYFAAVELDRRIAFNKDLLAQQMSPPL